MRRKRDRKCISLLPIANISAVPHKPVVVHQLVLWLATQFYNSWFVNSPQLFSSVRIAASDSDYDRKQPFECNFVITNTITGLRSRRSCDIFNKALTLLLDCSQNRLAKCPQTALWRSLRGITYTNWIAVNIYIYICATQRYSLTLLFKLFYFALVNIHFPEINFLDFYVVQWACELWHHF